MTKYVWAVMVNNQVVTLATSRQEAREASRRLRDRGQQPSTARAPMSAFTTYNR